MSVFSSKVTKELTVPGGTDTITIRKLAPRHLEAAAKEQQREFFANLKSMSDGIDEFKKLRDGEKKDPKPSAGDDDGPTNPLVLFDRLTLIEKGVIGWSFAEERTRENFEDLDSDTAEWLATEILTLAKPRLFQTKAQAAEDRKNG